MTVQNNSVAPTGDASRSVRGRRLTIAALVTLGLGAGGAVLADAALASGSGTSGSSGSTASGAPRPAGPGGGARTAGDAANDLDGVVTSASSSSLSVRSLFGTSRTYALTSKTVVHSGPGTTASASALSDGLHVHVHGSKNGSSYTATVVDIVKAHIDGSVTAASDDSITVTDRDGFTRTIALSSSTTYYKDGAKASRSDVTTGVVIRAEGSVDSNGTTLDASRVEVVTKEQAPGGPGGGPGGPGAQGGPRGDGPRPPAPGTKGAPKAPSGEQKAPSGAPKAPSGAPKAPSGAPSGSASSGS